MSMIDKWKNAVSADEEAAINKAMEEDKKNRRSYKEVPSGVYPVVIDKMEVGQSTWGTNQINITFTISEGEYAKQKLFYNGTFDDHFAHGINRTAELLEGLLDDDRVSAAMIAVIIGRGADSAEAFLADAAEECEALSYDLDYDIQLSKKLNPRTNAPYKNTFFHINGVYER